MVTNGKQLLYNPSAFFSGYASGGIDYGASSILNPMEGKPMPTVERVPGGAIIRNSFYANHLMSKRYYGETRGYVTSFATGKDTYAHVLHERKHIIQNRTREGSINGEGGGIFKYFGGGKEIEADLSAGYIGYQQTAMLIRWMNYNKFISDEFYNQLINWSNFNKGY
ncbi:hypothetical protein LEP1GSC061_0001 [Leptospira wolffii serovar Khorat str. Khorat-H2]|nr:hypothetical protein LEP1GSC061_0001 [Leptospira wolffii serovar Khorat str. Khorat-H2]